MSVTCGIIAVSKPANITATDITYSTTDCEEPCNVTVTITWKNTGGKTATITPGIVVDGITTPAPAPITLAKDETAIVVFHLTGLLEGNHSVCPDPN